MPAALSSLGRAAVTSVPRNVTRPVCGFRKPKMVRSSVDLPAPLGPITSVISFAAALIDRPRRMSTPGM